ncbi:MAG: ribosome maturation factor RimM [Termitinemataceae bacterium]
MTERFVTGIIGQPFGLKGHVKIEVPSGDSSHLECLEVVSVRLGNVEKQLVIEETRYGPASFLIKFRGFDTPEAAKTLRGGEILVDRDQAAPLEEDEYYIEDLKGLPVVLGHSKGQQVGTVTDIVEGGGGQLMEVRLPTGELRLIPFRNEFIGDIDIHEGWVLLKEAWILD